MRGGRRSSFATRLLAGSLTLVLGVLVAVTAVLLVSREHATRTTALSNADQRAGVLGQLIARETAVTGQGVVAALAAQPALRDALHAPDPGAATRALFPSPATITPRGHFLAILGPTLEPLFETLPSGLRRPDASLPAVRAALRATSSEGVPSVELLGGASGKVSVDTAARVGSAAAPDGVVVDVAPLDDQLRAFAPVLGPDDYAAVFVPSVRPEALVRMRAGRVTESPTPADIAARIRAGGAAIDGSYAAPVAGGGEAQVAGGFVAVKDALGQVTGYVGVEAPLALFSGDTRNDELTVLLIALFVILLTAALVLLFVDRFVRRPVARLERGVARIAGGDYSADIPITSNDELGRLAGAVNRMRAQIEASIAEIEQGRRRLDRAVERLGGVSRALTSTSSVAALQTAVVRAAAAMIGGDAAGLLLVRDGDALTVASTTGIDGGADLDEWGVTAEIVGGRAVRVDDHPPGWHAGGLLAVPMFYSDRVVGALAVISAAGRRPVDGDEQALAVLANNAAIAMENTRLFDRERETVRRLRELDRMKTDFLATVQHELRTPLTAIIGLSDLLELYWDSWPDSRRVAAITDIQTASRNLYDLVETIIDFTLIEREQLDLAQQPTTVAPQVHLAIAELAARLPGGVAPAIGVEVADELSVSADPARFRQVIRALLDNAVKFSPEGGGISVVAVAAGDHARIEVIDHGIGMSEADLPRIFDRFYQVDNSVTRAFGGAGMGLALVRLLVDAHQARVSVESRVGEGTRVIVEWPAAPAVAHGGQLEDPLPTAS